LAEQVIRILSRPGDNVVDPFVGSGSTLVAAQSLGRGGSGFDIVPAFVKTARNRLQGRRRRDLRFIPQLATPQARRIYLRHARMPKKHVQIFEAIVQATMDRRLRYAPLPEVRTLAMKLARVSERTVQRALPRLIQAELIERLEGASPGEAKIGIHERLLEG
jgi:hypothetical protein